MKNEGMIKKDYMLLFGDDDRDTVLVPLDFYKEQEKNRKAKRELYGLITIAGLIMIAIAKAVFDLIQLILAPSNGMATLVLTGLAMLVIATFSIIASRIDCWLHKMGC